jgi:outer membrane protein TolC
MLGGLALPLLLPAAAPAAGEVLNPAARADGILIQVEEARALPGAAGAAPSTAADTDKDPAKAPPADTVQSLSLADCIRIALEQQPGLAAQRASLASAESSRQGLDNLRVPTFIARDLPIRRQQACLGVTIAAAAVDQAERDSTYAVTRTYFTVLYAREQARVAARVVRDLSDALENAKRLLGKEGAPRDLTQNSVDKNRTYLRLAEARQVDAQEGAERALAALREAMGVAPNFAFTVPEGDIPDPRFDIVRGDMVALALARRGELVQANTLAAVTALEVDAQGTSCHSKKLTFAAGADIHARAIPPEINNQEYRPGGIPPEMPTTLVGSKSARMDRARDLSARASAVADKTRGLITLEAEDAFLRWEEAARKIPKTREASNVSKKLADDTLNDFKGGQNVPYKDVLEAVVLSAQAGSAYNEARYQYILALAALERITGGGFNAGLAATASAAK